MTVTPGEVSVFAVESHVDKFVAEGLKLGARYRVWINAVSAVGVGPDSQHVYGVVIDRSEY